MMGYFEKMQILGKMMSSEIPLNLVENIHPIIYFYVYDLIKNHLLKDLKY